MNKLFILQEHKNNDYSRELAKGLDVCGGKFQIINLEELTSDYLINNSIDVVISNGLPKEWYFVLKGLKIVTVTMDEIKDYFSLADIVIDYKSKDSNKYFTGDEYSIVKNKDFDFQEIVDLISRLNWDSDFWGFPVAYLSSKHLSENILHRIERFIKKEDIRLLQYLCNCHDIRSVRVAERNGFNFIDIRLTFEKSLIEKNNNFGLPANITFNKAQKDDIEELKKISGNLYPQSRYFFDINFDPERVKDFYENWVEKGVLGQFDNECYCLYHSGIPVGFCTIRYNISNTVNIGLFGVANDFQGKGLAKLLLNAIFNILIDKKISKLFVVTQGRNYGAQRLYQNTGFLTKSTELWYHKWI